LGPRKGIVITLSAADRTRLEAVVADRNSSQEHVWRCRIVLLTADGLETAAIMQRTGKSKSTVRRWQERFMQAGVEGLLPPEPPPEFAAKARDLESLSGAVADAAVVSGPLWISYLLALFYFLVAAGAVTHTSLFLEQPVKLPFLGIDLPLTGFFWLAPIVFFILHAYTLLHFVIFTGKVSTFDTELRRQIKDREQRRQLRGQLPTNLFVILLAGPPESRGGVVGMLLWLIALISLVIGPQVLLLFFLLQFLPYHSSPITWTQRIVVLLDLGLLWALWPKLVRADKPPTRWPRWYLRWVVVPLRRQRRREVRIHHVVARHPRFYRLMRLPRPKIGRLTSVLATAFVLVLVFLVASFPGENLDGWIGQNVVWMPGLRAVRIALVEGVVDPATSRLKSWFSNVLVVPGISLTEDPRFDAPAKIEAVHRTLRLRNRELRGAVLTDADLRAADLEYARLQGAILDDAQLQRASLSNADLEGARLNRAQLQGALLNHTHLTGASLDGANLGGASLDYADLEGARLNPAELHGSSLGFNPLEQEYYDADLRGASLIGADLRGASLDGANLGGASLIEADLRGASLEHADLRGALLDSVQLQGASLYETNFGSAWLYCPRVWRADPSLIAAAGMLWLTAPGTDPVSQSDYDKLKASVERDIALGQRRLRRDWALMRILNLDPRRSQPWPAPHESVMALSWRELALMPKDSEDDRIPRLVQFACDPTNAPYVIQGIVSNFVSDLNLPLPPAPHDLARALLAPDCASTRMLDEHTRARLAAFATEP
jgi:uncharacterized protein YjbI with pentapeptide repeats